MPDRIQSQRVICQGGLNKSENSLLLSEQFPGAAVRLVNYETALSGGYRRIDGFEYLDANFPGPTGEGAVLCVTGFTDTPTGLDYFICARKDVGTNTYSFYYLDLFGGGWTAFTTGITARSTIDPIGNNIKRVRVASFNFGTINMLIFVDGCNPACIYDGTTWYELTSGGAGTSVSPGGDQIIDYPAVVDIFKSSIFLSGDENNPSIVSYSAPSDPFDWTAASGAGQMIFSQPVVQIKPFRDRNYVFGQSQIKFASPDTTAGFIFSDVTTDLGCIARDSVLEVGGNLVFMSADGIRPVAGTYNIADVELSLLSQNIQDLINQTIIDNDMTDLVGVSIRKKTQFRHFFSNDAIAVTDAKGIIGCLRGNQWEFFEILGIRASCAWSGFLSSTEYILHGDYDGKVYIEEIQSTSFNGDDILSVYTTPYLDFGDTEVRKLMRTLNVFLKPEGSVTFSMAVRFDWGDINAVNPSNYTGLSVDGPILYGGGSTYGGGSSYGGATKKVLKTNIQGSCFSVQFSIVSQGTYAPHTMQGLVCEFSTKGRD